jgi:hypothetical protein
LGTAAHQETTEVANLSALDDDASTSDSADNPSATVTAHLTTDKHYDERIARGKGDVGRCNDSEAEERLPSYQLGGEPPVCRA